MYKHILGNGKTFLLNVVLVSSITEEELCSPVVWHYRLWHLLETHCFMMCGFQSVITGMSCFDGVMRKKKHLWISPWQRRPHLPSEKTLNRNGLFPVLNPFNTHTLVLTCGLTENVAPAVFTDITVACFFFSLQLVWLGHKAGLWGFSLLFLQALKNEDRLKLLKESFRTHTHTHPCATHRFCATCPDITRPGHTDRQAIQTRLKT